MEAVLFLHLLWCCWVLFGWTVTRYRPVVRTLHIASLVYAIAVETVPWLPCLLNLAETWLETRAGIEPAHGPFLVRVLDAVVYPNGSSLNWILPTRVANAANKTLYTASRILRSNREPVRFANSGGKLSCVPPKDCFCASLERKSVLANAPTGQLRIEGESKLGGSCHFFGKICTLFAFAAILVLNASCAPRLSGILGNSKGWVFQPCLARLLT